MKLGTYIRKVPTYNSLQACRGTTFFLPLPLEKKCCNSADIEASKTVSLPDPELFIIVNGVPTKKKVIWRTLVDIK